MTAFAMLQNYKKSREEDQQVSKLRKAVNEANKAGLMVIGDNTDYGNHKMKDGDKFVVEFVDVEKQIGFYQVSMFGMPKLANGRYPQNQIFKTLEEAEEFAEKFSRPNPTLQVGFLVYVLKHSPGEGERKFRASVEGKMTKNNKPYQTLEEVIANKEGRLAILKTSAKYGLQVAQANERYKGLEGRVFEWSRTGAGKDDTSYGLDFLPSDCYDADGIKPIAALSKKKQTEIKKEIAEVDIDKELFPEGFEELRDSVIAKESKNFAKAISARVARETSEASNWGS